MLITKISSKHSKSERKEDAILKMEPTTKLLEQHHEKLATEFKTSFNLLDLKLDQTRFTVKDLGQRVSSLELAADDLSQRVTELENLYTALCEDSAMFNAKVTDLEGWSRCQSIRILGLPESTENGSPTELFLSLLYEVFGNANPSAPQLRSQRLDTGHAWSSFACTNTR